MKKNKILVNMSKFKSILRKKNADGKKINIIKKFIYR